MRIKFLLVFLLSINMVIQAQTDKKAKENDGDTHHKSWVRGFVVTKNGDTIRGIMKDKVSAVTYDMQYQLSFDGPDGITRHYTPDSLSSFTLYREHDNIVDTAKYVAIKINDDMIKHAFLRLYIDGPCKIYGYTTMLPPGAIGLFSSGKKTFTTIEYTYIRLENGSLIPPKRIKFKKDMKEIFAECPLIISRLDSEDYTFDNWQDIVKDYNHGICK